MRRSAPILISVAAAQAAPARDSSHNVAAIEEREMFRIFDSKNQVSAFCRDGASGSVTMSRTSLPRQSCLSARMAAADYPAPDEAIAWSQARLSFLIQPNSPR